ncbi:hypothetical protein, partial [Thiobacillus sp.]|uniref:hypothetical protein n=1 Tax=Thiobacillus sp. TaxID=924 RepID=UPI0025F82F0B
VIAAVLLHHADSAFTYLGGILGGGLLALHGFILSRVEASSKPGAVQHGISGHRLDILHFTLVTIVHYPRCRSVLVA